MLKPKLQKKSSYKQKQKRGSCFQHNLSSEGQYLNEPSQWNTIAMEIQQLKNKIVRISKTPLKRHKVSMDTINHECQSKQNEEKVSFLRSKQHLNGNKQTKNDKRKKTLQVLSSSNSNQKYHGSSQIQDQIKIGQVNLVFQSIDKISRKKKENQVKQLKKTIKNLDRQNKILEHKLFFQNMQKQKLKKELKEALNMKKSEFAPALTEKNNKIFSTSNHCKTECPNTDSDKSFIHIIQKKNISDIACKQNIPKQLAVKNKQRMKISHEKSIKQSQELIQNYQQQLASDEDTGKQSFLLSDFEITQSLISKDNINSTIYQDATLKRYTKTYQDSTFNPFCTDFVKDKQIAQLQSQFAKLIGQSSKNQNPHIKSQIRMKLVSIANQIRNLKVKDNKYQVDKRNRLVYI